jgi:predicted ATPase
LSRVTVASRSPQAPFVGRDRELNMLHARLAQAVAGRDRIASIRDEAGVGKTALATSLAREGIDRGARTVVGHCHDRTETPL